MKRIFINFALIILIIISFSGCGASDELPLNATFKNGTLYGSENYVVTVCFGEDKRLHQYYTDVLIKSSEPVILKIGKELNEQIEINFNDSEWQSLTELFNQTQKTEFVTFHRAQTTTYIINADKKVKLEFSVIGGDYSYNTATGRETLVNTFEVSKVFELEM